MFTRLVDFAVQGVANAGSTHWAANSEAGNLRWNMRKGVDSIFNDARLAGGVGAGILSALIPAKYDMAKRGIFDVGTGALHSLIATEGVRRVAVKRQSAGGWGVQSPGAAAAPAQIPAAAPAAAAGVRKVVPVSVGYGAW